MLRIYDVAVKMLEDMRPALGAIETRDRDLAWQMRRAASSVVLNLAEGSRRFLVDPRSRALLFDPGGTNSPSHRALCPTLRRVGVAFRYCEHVGSHDFTPFEAQSHGPRARCLRFAARVARGPRKTRFRLVALLGRSGFEPAGSKRKVSAISFAFPFPRLFLAHRRRSQGSERSEDGRRPLGLDAAEHAGKLVDPERAPLGVFRDA